MTSPTEPEPHIIRVLLADDQPMILQGIATILRAEPDIEVVGTVGTGDAAVRMAGDTAPDVICMDIEMPGIDGIEATAQILRSATARTQIIMLTTFGREDYLLRALRSGASGFLLKTASPEQLADGIRTVASGEALLAPEVTRPLIKHAVSGAGTASRQPAGAAPAVGAVPWGTPLQPADGHEQLTSREREVLALAALGLSNTEIGQHLFIGAETVKTHMSNVLLKLNLRNRIEAVAYAYRNGIAAADH